MSAAMLHVVPKREQKRGRFSGKREFLSGEESMMSGILGRSACFLFQGLFSRENRF